MGLVDTIRQVIQMLMKTCREGRLELRKPLKAADMAKAWVAGVTGPALNCAMFTIFGGDPVDPAEIARGLEPAFDQEEALDQFGDVSQW